jgi:hypothetical protein
LLQDAIINTEAASVAARAIVIFPPILSEA